MTQSTSTQLSPKFQIVVGLLAPHVRAQALEQDFPRWTEAEWESHGKQVTVRLVGAWLAILGFAADVKKRPVTAHTLDDDMLPNDLEHLDAMIAEITKGDVDEEALRNVLRRYKATIPECAVLPVPVIACLLDLGVRCA